MDNNRYYPRVVDGQFKRKLSAIGAILIEGPKLCGKTTTAKMMSASAIYLQDPDYRDYYISKANDKPSELLKGEYPRLIDEWQDIPKIWDAIRFDVDSGDDTHKYILTGSSVPKEKELKQVKHTSTGCIARVRMYPMSLFESKESDGSTSLRDLFDGGTGQGSQSALSLEELAFVLCRGGWPRALGKDREDALEMMNLHYSSLIHSDMSRVDDVKRDPVVVDAVLKSLSRNICTLAETTTIAADVRQYASRPTVMDYISALRKIFVVEDIPSWKPSLLSKARLRTSPKRCLSDPSIAIASLGMGPGMLLRDMPSFGSFFESMVIRDLRVYSQLLDGTVYHYHDTSDLEVDAIIALRDGRWCAIEVKLSGGEDEGARDLLRFARKTRLVDGSVPSFLAVITGVGFSHMRPDGVLVVPIGCLGP